MFSFLSRRERTTHAFVGPQLQLSSQLQQSLGLKDRELDVARKILTEHGVYHVGPKLPGPDLQNDAERKAIGGALLNVAVTRALVQQLPMIIQMNHRIEILEADTSAEGIATRKKLVDTRKMLQEKTSPSPEIAVLFKAPSAFLKDLLAYASLRQNIDTVNDFQAAIGSDVARTVASVGAEEAEVVRQTAVAFHASGSLDSLCEYTREQATQGSVPVYNQNWQDEAGTTPISFEKNGYVDGNFTQYYLSAATGLQSAALSQAFSPNSEQLLKSLLILRLLGEYQAAAEAQARRAEQKLFDGIEVMPNVSQAERIQLGQTVRAVGDRQQRSEVVSEVEQVASHHNTSSLGGSSFLRKMMQGPDPRREEQKDPKPEDYKSPSPKGRR